MSRALGVPEEKEGDFSALRHEETLTQIDTGFSHLPRFPRLFRCKHATDGRHIILQIFAGKVTQMREFRGGSILDCLTRESNLKNVKSPTLSFLIYAKTNSITSITRTFNRKMLGFEILGCKQKTLRTSIQTLPIGDADEKERCSALVGVHSNNPIPSSGIDSNLSSVALYHIITSPTPSLLIIVIKFTGSIDRITR